MNDKIGLKEALAIGIGGMVGGGIFVVPGVAADLAKGRTPVAFCFLIEWAYKKIRKPTENGQNS